MSEQTPELENFDEEDIKTALEKTDTADGYGTDPIRESDFEAFAEDDVEKGDYR